MVATQYGLVVHWLVYICCLMNDFWCLMFQDFQISNLGNKSTLTIMEVFPEDEGHYSCRAINSEGEITSNCQLLVEGRQPSVCLFLLQLTV